MCRVPGMCHTTAFRADWHTSWCVYRHYVHTVCPGVLHLRWSCCVLGANHFNKLRFNQQCSPQRFANLSECFVPGVMPSFVQQWSTCQHEPLAHCEGLMLCVPALTALQFPSHHTTNVDTKSPVLPLSDGSVTKADALCVRTTPPPPLCPTNALSSQHLCSDRTLLVPKFFRCRVSEHKFQARGLGK